MQPAVDLGFIRRLEEQLEGFDEIRRGLLDRLTLTRAVEFGAERDIGIVLALDDGGQTVEGSSCADSVVMQALAIEVVGPPMSTSIGSSCSIL